MTSHKGEGVRQSVTLWQKGEIEERGGSKNCVTSFMNGAYSQNCFAECTNLRAIMDVSQLLGN